MNWTKVKTVLIILFVLINIMLIGILATRNANNVRLSDDAVEEIFDLLSKNGITVDKSAVSKKAEEMSVPEATPITNGSSMFVKSLGEKFKLNEKGDYVNGKTKISVYEDVVHFENEIGEVKKKTSFNEALALCTDYLKKYGIDVSEADVAKEETDDGYVITFLQKYGGYDVFGTYAKVNVLGENIKSVDLLWYEIPTKNAATVKTISSAEALLEFVSDKTRGSKSFTVKEVNFGYAAETENSGDVLLSQMIPTAEIVTDIDSKFYYDARIPD